MIDLSGIARSIVAEGKGLLAADESNHTATKRLAEHGAETSEEMRRQYRDLFLGTQGIEQHLSGVILFTETLTQKGDDGKLFPRSLADRGILPGVKVDLGTEPMPESPEEMVTNGLIGLSERLAQYKAQGAQFTKWRAVIRIDGDQLPTARAIHENAKRLAGYAKEVQTAGMVPILEPEVLLAGKHSRARSRAVIEQTLQTLFAVLEEYSVDPSGLIIKTAMARSGMESSRKDTPEEVAADTVDGLVASIPKQVPGVVFLSGGETPDEATNDLAAITAYARTQQPPWPLTFSYARALQEEALSLWHGKAENVPAARAAFLARLQKVAQALA